MAFDEDGQADNLDRRKAICERAYRILVDEVGFPPEDIIFDPNVFAVATGIEEHATYGQDFIEATRWIKQNLPGAQGLRRHLQRQFSFRGNNPVREAIHAVFLFHAIRAGLDMGIVNAGALVVYDEVDPELRERIEDVVLNRRADAAERLLEIAERYNSRRPTPPRRPRRSGARCPSASGSPTPWSRASTPTSRPTPRSSAQRSPSAAAARSRSSRAR